MLPMGNVGGGMPGMLSPMQGSSLLGREMSPAPASPMTQPLQVGGAPALSLGTAFGNDASAATHMAPIPPGRSIASMRAPRGTNFIRLAFAAIFLLGFLGLVGYLLKDYLPGLLPGLMGNELAEEASKEAPLPSPPAPPSAAIPIGDSAAPQSVSSPKGKPSPAPITVGFDPQEPVAPTTETAPTVAEIKDTARSSPPPAAPSAAPMVSTPVATAPTAETLLEVPAKPAMNGEPAGSPSATPSSQVQLPVIEEEDIPPAASPAVEALKKFLAAKSLEERLRYTLGAELMKPLMERYYARAPEGPILVDRIQYVRMDPNPELGSGKHCILSLENKAWEFAVPVMLEEKEDGFKVDWVAFVEFKDRMLEKFFQAYQEGKACFHVGIIRHHYFEDAVPNLDRKDAFRVSPAPPNSFQASVFLDKDADLAQELRTRMPWETHVWAVVELEWKKLGSQQWVELSAVPQMHWYSLPMAPKAVSMPQNASIVDDPPPGISKNGNRGKSGSQTAEPPPGIRKSTPDLPSTIKRPLPAGR
ncbi:MAG: hypothetical protein B7Z37_01595 [Verrucomicrobia bacterium 12-59-8]|nr:MAG: hypothetical protein B7Z37_01595 [Verrucomicrobia bacterium 12-59-8]